MPWNRPASGIAIIDDQLHIGQDQVRNEAGVAVAQYDLDGVGAAWRILRSDRIGLPNGAGDFVASG